MEKWEEQEDWELMMTIFKLPNAYIQRRVTSYFQTQLKQNHNSNKTAAHGI